MAESGYNILWAVITEIIVIRLAIALKHNKRKVVAVLITGTLFAGIIWIGLPFYLSLRENAPSLPNGSFPIFEPTGSIPQTEIAEKLDTINTYKVRGTTKFTNREGKPVIHQVEVEYVRPNKQHTTLIYEGREVEETIIVGEQYCMRHGQQDDWFCGDRGSSTSDAIQGWIWIVKGQASPGNTAIDHGVRAYTWHNKKCRLYYITEVSSDPLFRGTEGESTVALCIDHDTLLPVEYFSSGKWPDAFSKGTQTQIQEFDVFDINKPIDISLPAQ